MISRRNLVCGGFTATVISTLMACTPQTEDVISEGQDDTPRSGGTLRFYINNPISIDPYTVQESSGYQVAISLFDTLVEYDWETKKLVGKAAESWEANDDATEFVFRLVEGATFHNGEPVTAMSFKRAWERICNPTMRPVSAIAYHLKPVLGCIQMLDGSATELSGVETPDDLTLRVTLAHPMADFPFICAHPALAPVPEAALDNPQGFTMAPIGNGPFQMDGEWVPSQHIRLRRYEDYHGAQPTLDGVDFVILPNPAQAFSEFEEGHVDFVPIAAGRFGELSLNYGLAEDGYTVTPGQQVLTGPECSAYYLAVNCKDKVMQDVDVRRAISLAIDRQRICDTIFGGTYLPADRIIPPSIDDDSSSGWEYCRYDLETAQALLDNAHPKRNDGMRDLQLGLLFNSGGGHEDIMAFVAEDLQKIGIEVRQSSIEWEAFLDAAKSGHYQLIRYGCVADYPTIDNFLYPLFFSTSTDNLSNYDNPDVDAALLSARGVVDEDGRAKAYLEVSKRIGDDLPVIPILFASHNHVGSSRVSRLFFDPQERAHFVDVELD